jgi:hypothetical protein
MELMAPGVLLNEGRKLAPTIFFINLPGRVNFLRNEHRYAGQAKKKLYFEAFRHGLRTGDYYNMLWHFFDVCSQVWLLF